VGHEAGHNLVSINVSLIQYVGADVPLYSISISVPYSTGEQYEGAAHLINMLQDRARAERDEVLAEFEAAGRGEESASIPPIRHSFTMIFFTPDSKVGTVF
jgi:hypothetical protein